MEALMKSVLEVMISMTLCILAVSLFKKISGNRYGFRIRYILWYLIVIRLLIPVNFSLPTALKINQPNIPVIQVTNSSNTNQETAYEIASKQVVVNSFEDAATMKTLGTDISIVAVVGYISLVITFIILLINIIKYISFLQYVKKSREEPSEELVVLFDKIKKSMKIKKNIPIYVVENLSSPMLIGIIKPFVIIPNMNLLPSQIKMVCMHELMHYKRHDIFLKWLLMFVKSIYWFNPVMLLLFHETNKDIELSCDESILKHRTMEYRKEYGNTILEVLRIQTKSPTIILSTSFNTNKYTVKERILCLLNTHTKQVSKKIVVGCMSIICLSSMFFAFTSANAQNTVPNRSIDRLETTDAIEYYFTIYNNELGIKVFKNAPFVMTVPKVIEADDGILIKGDITFEFVDKETNQVLKKFVYSTNRHFEIDKIYDEYKRYLYAYEGIEDAYALIQDYVVIHSDYYLTDEFLRDSASACVIIREKNDGTVDLELSIQNQYDLQLPHSPIVDIPESNIEAPTINVDDRMKASELRAKECPTFDNMKSSNVSINFYEGVDAVELYDSMDNIKLQMVTPFGKVLEGSSIDAVIHVNQEYEVINKK